MRIAQVSPLYESVPPRLYGGTERIVHYVTEELVRMGHDVTLFASGDSETAARLQAQCAQALRLDEKCVDPLARHVLMIERVAAWESEFDVIHFHTDYLHFPLARRMTVPHLTTLHGRLDIADLAPVYDEFGDIPVVSISDAQRRPLPQAGWLSTVHHGLPKDLLGFNPEPEGYFAFVGRISPEKRVDRAIEIATALGVPLKIAAKVDKVDLEYFKEKIEPMLDHHLVEFVGEIGEAEKSAFMGGARALLFPIDWPEPFGLVMIEAMACGTPVVAFRNGSVDEVLEDGVTGFIVESVEDAIAAAKRVGELDRARVRAEFERRFTAERMATEYVELYTKLAARKTLPSGITESGPPPALPETEGETETEAA
ncbi:MAG TPA: glycosyltransferase family 4 protein [Polyangiaceae bacterium]|jgi:glycosyltransferase involved in cell wall biosynthesis|nr:glycosyltransferase family 4 protein [Polyangiaceae bacterium]